MATVTQEIGRAGNISATVTFNNATGAVSSISVTNTAAFPLSLVIWKAGTAHVIPVPVGTTTISNKQQLQNVALVNDGSGNWDFDLPNGDGWELRGT